MKLQRQDGERARTRHESGGSRVEVSFYKRPDQNNGFVQVRLRSDFRTGLISKRNVDLDDVGGFRELRRQVEVTGGALAEYQCERYGDEHDPEACARTAAEALDELWVEIGGDLSA